MGLKNRELQTLKDNVIFPVEISIILKYLSISLINICTYTDRYLWSYKHNESTTIKNWLYYT